MEIPILFLETYDFYIFETLEYFLTNYELKSTLKDALYKNCEQMWSNEKAEYEVTAFWFLNRK